MGDTGEGRPLRAWVLCALLGITGLSGAQALSGSDDNGRKGQGGGGIHALPV